MKKAIKYLFLLSLITLTISACKTRKKTADNVTIDSNTMMLWEKINEANIDFEWFYAKANANVSFDNMSFGGRADIRIEKDEKILISIRKFGFEIAKALFRPDSVFMINRFEGSYLSMSFDSIQNAFDVPFSFDELQEIIVGNNIVKKQVPLNSISSGDEFLLKSSDNEVGINYRLDKEYVVKSSSLRDSKGRSFKVLLSKYKDFGLHKEIASERSYFYPSAENPQYTLIFELDKVEINEPKKMKFEIPSGYEIM